ncbi:hypothetical protein STHERM_c02490 [Spirochaeta thermophila DSM 6192]|uniref:Uncharacterized protein n=2 Tax=Winmispira thermophila TaxID=154 RepID=E0RNV0_WINT6|nr:hypothetical protein STHERM_c02490 [Spirochaeta thermophila DSM 6192]
MVCKEHRREGDYALCHADGTAMWGGKGRGMCISRQDKAKEWWRRRKGWHDSCLLISETPHGGYTMKHRDKRTLVIGSMLLVLLGLLLTVGCANPVNSDIERIAASVTSEDGSQSTDDVDLSADTPQTGNESSEDLTAEQSGEDPQPTVSQSSGEAAAEVSADGQGADEGTGVVAGGDAAEAESAAGSASGSEDVVAEVSADGQGADEGTGVVAGGAAAEAESAAGSASGSEDVVAEVSADGQGADEESGAVAGGDAAEAEEDSLLAALEEAVAASKDLTGKVVIDGAGYLVISTDQGTYELAISDDPEELRDDLQDLWKEHKKDKELKRIAQELRKILASVTEASEREQGKKEKDKKRK